MISSYRRVASVFVFMLSCLLGSCAYKKAAPMQAVDQYVGGAGGGGGDRDQIREGRAGILAKLESRSGPSPKMMMITNGSPATSGANGESATQADRKIIRTGSLDLLVNDVGKTVDGITSTISGMGGYVEKAERQETGMKTASMIVRVPAARLDEAMAKVRSMATRVDTDTIQAQDVTRDFIDLDARLRNTQAEEARYLDIMKRASTVKDTLEVAEKLSDVRGRIEQLQGEMNYLKTQISLSRLDVSLHAESEATVMGLHWKPLRQAKAASVDMLQGLADWMDSVIAFVINIPLILVWIVSIVVLIALAWRIVRFVWRKLFPNASGFAAWLRRVRAKPGTPGQA